MRIPISLPSASSYAIGKLLAILLSAASLAAHAQSAEPALTGAYFAPDTVRVGEQAALTFGFVNSGADAIPAKSVQLSVCPALDFYKPAGQPAHTGNAVFAWKWSKKTQCWSGTNTKAIAGTDGGEVTVPFKALKASEPKETHITINILNKEKAFANTTANDAIAPDLLIKP